MQEPLPPQAPLSYATEKTVPIGTTIGNTPLPITENSPDPVAWINDRSKKLAREHVLAAHAQVLSSDYEKDTSHPLNDPVTRSHAIASLGAQVVGSKILGILAQSNADMDKLVAITKTKEGQERIAFKDKLYENAIKSMAVTEILKNPKLDPHKVVLEKHREICAQFNSVRENLGEGADLRDYGRISMDLSDQAMKHLVTKLDPEQSEVMTSHLQEVFSPWNQEKDSQLHPSNKTPKPKTIYNYVIQRDRAGNVLLDPNGRPYFQRVEIPGWADFAPRMLTDACMAPNPIAGGLHLAGDMLKFMAARRGADPFYKGAITHLAMSHQLAASNFRPVDVQTPVPPPKWSIPVAPPMPPGLSTLEPLAALPHPRPLPLSASPTTPQLPAPSRIILP